MAKTALYGFVRSVSGTKEGLDAIVEVCQTLPDITYVKRNSENGVTYWRKIGLSPQDADQMIHDALRVRFPEMFD